MIRYDEHAEFQIVRRDIEKAWIEETLRNPDANGRPPMRSSRSVYRAVMSCCAW